MHLGLHFTPMGYRCLFDDLMALVENNYLEQGGLNDYVLPRWRTAPGLGTLSKVNTL